MTEQHAINGACNCGAIRYRLARPPMAVIACHCTQCRRQSGAAYSVNLVVRAESMMVEGALACWEDQDTESGVPVQREFCGRCGSPIRSAPGASPGILAVKAGTLDEPGEFSPMMHIWTQSKLPWVELPEGIPAFEKSPKG